jgi:hypothetical protein
MTGRFHAGRFVDVLQCDRDAVQRTPPQAAAHFHIGLTRGVEGDVGGDGDVAGKGGIDGLDARQECLGERRRGEIAACHQAAGLGDAQRREIASREIGHGMALLVRPEDLGRLGGPRPALWDPLHQAEQPDIALVQMPDVFLGQGETGQRGACPEFLERWRLDRRCHENPPPK